MTKSNYLKNYAESFAIFAKYEPASTLDLEYVAIGISLAEDVTPEDDAHLLELGWTKGSYRGYYKDERGTDLDDYS